MLLEGAKIGLAKGAYWGLNSVKNTVSKMISGMQGELLRTTGKKFSLLDIINGKAKAEVIKVQAKTDWLYKKKIYEIDKMEKELWQQTELDNKTVSRILGKPHYENIEPLGPPYIQGRIGPVVNDNSRLRLINNTEKTVVDQSVNVKLDKITKETGKNEIILTAKDKIVADPFKARKYIRNVEEITNLGVKGKPLNELKKALQKQEFKKLDSVAYIKHRDDFRNKVKNLRKEWEINTGKKWPKYEKDIYNESGKLIKEKGWNYDAHHLIKLEHGGPNTWWNIHPASIVEHGKIHCKGSIEKEIFGK